MFRRLLNTLYREEGQDLVEYGLVIALIAVVAIAALTLMGCTLSTILVSIADAM
jgi:Flp pilus assembly pilin Flp